MTAAVSTSNDRVIAASPDAYGPMTTLPVLPVAELAKLDMQRDAATDLADSLSIPSVAGGDGAVDADWVTASGPELIIG